MRRRRNHSDDLGVSLFPFLAVLLCTMGALIVLLLVITDRARNTTDEPPPAAETVAETVAAPPSGEDDPNTWRQRAEQLAATREQVQKIVQDRRTRLGLLERAQRELENKLVELKARLDEQQRLAKADADEVAKTEAELARLEARAAEGERNLEEIRQENTNRPASYSIVPYEGPNSTPRRPVYIECRSDRVVLQPEGIELGKEDFLIAADAGNPLATVLRATREYLVTSRSLKDEEEPYPLIIVRPDGVEAYYAVRQSLQGWTTDFGYELVNEDWKLTFGPADPNLAIEQNRALAEARVRQAGLVAMLDRRPKKNPSYRPAPRGGIVRDGDDTGFGTPSIPYHGEDVGEPGDGDGSNSGDGSNNGEFADGAGGNHGRSGVSGSRDAAGNGYGQGSTGREGGSYTGQRGGQDANGVSAATGGMRNAPGSGAHGGLNDASGGGGTYAGGDRRGTGGDGSLTDGSDGARPRDGRGSATIAGDIRGSTGGPRDPVATAGGDSAYPHGQPRPAGNAVGGNDSGGANGSGDGGGSSGGSGASGGGGDSSGGSQFSSGAPDPSQRQESATLDSESLARRRGRDWGLRYAAPTATPVTRPLRITCYGDRVIVQSDDPRREPKQIAFQPQTGDSADEFVAAVWAEIKAWGIAGKGMYWRPILSFDVQGGGDRRYEDLRKLLDGSGFEVRRKPTAVADQRPVGTPTSPRSARPR